MKTTPTLDRLASTDRTPGSHRTARRRAAWLTVLGLLVVGLIAIGFALSRVDTAEEPATDVPSEEPAAEQPGTGDPPGQAPMIRYHEELRANWDVVGVAAGDVLNVRDVPGVAGTIIAVLAHDAAELESTGRIAYVGGQLWREVIVPGDGAGWVSARYVGES